MKLDLAGLDPAPTAMVANLPYSVATPLILRTIEQLPSLRALDGDGAARDRRPAARGAGQPHLRLAERASPSSPARSSCCARSTPPSSGRGRGSTRRSCGLRRTGPGADPATRELVRAAFAHRRKSLARSLEHAEPGLARAGAGGAGRARACAEDARAEALSPERVRRPVREAAGRRLSAASRRDARPRPRQAQPLPLPRPAPRRRPARALLAVRAAGAGRPDRRSPKRSATRSSAPGSRARTSPRGRWRRCASAAGSGRRCGSRSRSGSRSRPGSAAAAPTPPRSCGWPPARSTDLQRARRRARRRRALAAAAGAGAGARRRRAGRARCRPRPPHAVVLLPDGGGLEHRRGLRRGRPARPRPRARRSSTSWPARCARAAGAGASPLAYPELLVNDLEPAARSLRPGDRRRARRAARGRRAARAAHRLRPDRVRALRRPRRGARGGRRRSTATTRSSARPGGGADEAAGRRARGGSRKRLLIAVDRRRGRPPATTCSAASSAHLDLQNLLEDVSNTLGAWTYLLVGVFAFAETGAFVGLVVPGETVMLLGGAVAGQGAIDIYLLIAIAWFSRLGRRHDQLLPRPPARARVRAPPRPALRDQPRALREGRGLLLPPRRQDDLHRPLHQPRARLRPLHRRQLGHALPRLRPLQHPRHRALGQRPHPGRLLLLAQHRDRRQVRRQRRLPARRR